MPSRSTQAVRRLHSFLLDYHWHDGALVGPDPGVRFNSRIGRFVKSYLSMMSWSDDLQYMQGQGYWIMSNWELAKRTNDSRFSSIAIEAADQMLSVQRPDGAWDYPNPEWKGRVATVEGCFAALALLDTYERTSVDTYLESALKWHDYLETEIGFRAEGGVNYWAHNSGTYGGVPNNTALVLRTLARLAEVTGEASYLQRAPALVSWLTSVQSESGEFPYAVSEEGVVTQHFWCFNYNSFEFIDLNRYLASTGDPAIPPLLSRLARFLTTGVSPSGACRYECDSDRPVVLYYTGALALALREATVLGLGDFSALADRASGWLLDRQRPDGSFEFYSARNYGLLHDRRSYPRYLAILLNHLVFGAAGAWHDEDIA